MLVESVSSLVYILQCPMGFHTWGGLDPASYMAPWCASDLNVYGSHCAAGEAIPVSPVNASGSEALPPGVCQRYCLWKSGSKDFIKHGSPLEKELQDEAAAKIQCHFRSWLASYDQGADRSSCSSKPPSRCSECHEPFTESQLDEVYPDRCDICNTFRHSSCLVACVNERGEWNVCSRCQWESNVEFLPADPKSEAELECAAGASESGGSEVMNPAPSSTVARLSRGSQDPEPHRPAPGHTSIAEGSVFQPLDNVLEFVIKFLEGEHTKSSSLSSGTHALVLDMVKQTLAWKQTERDKDEVHAKVLEINQMMSTIVAGL